MTPYLIAALAIASASSFGTYRVMDWKHDSTLKTINEKQTQKDQAHEDQHLAQERELHALEQARSRHALDALNAARKRETAMRADAARLRDSHERVLGASEAALAAAGKDHQSCLVSAAAFRVVFDNCSTEYRKLGADSQGHVTDIETLTGSWPK